MYCKFAFATLAVLIGNEFVIAEQIPPTTTAAELWNPWTWFWPYAIAAAEGYRDYFQKAQKATNELYMQAEKLNAFPWITSTPQSNNQGGNGVQNNQTQPNQSGGTQQNNQSGSSQSNQNNGREQNNQAGPSQPNQSDNQTPTEEQGSKGGAESPSVQAQGNTQEDGKTDAGIGVNA